MTPPSSRFVTLSVTVGFSLVIALCGLFPASTSPAAEPPVVLEQSCCNVLELRQYTLRPGTREPFVNLFDNVFTDPLEAAGMTVVGQFRDLDREDRFVWIRGFQDMPARATELTAFYQSDLWRSRRDEVNASIDDADNVLLLEPASPALRLDKVPFRPASPESRARVGLVVITLYYTKSDDCRAFGALFDSVLRPRAEAAGARTLAAYVTSAQDNNYPKLKVRSGEHIFVWVATFEHADAYASYLAKMTADKHWSAIWHSVRAQLSREPEILRLSPTSRSRLPG
jgi:NIPSNAP